MTLNNQEGIDVPLNKQNQNNFSNHMKSIDLDKEIWKITTCKTESLKLFVDLWQVLGNPSLELVPDQLWLGMVILVRNLKLLTLDRNTSYLITVRKQIIIIIYSFSSFSHQRYPMVSRWNLIDGKSPQVSWTLLSILADLNNAVVSMVSTRPLISKSTHPCTNPLVTVPSAPITIGITVTFMFQSFKFPRNVQVIILLFAFFQFYSVVSRNSKVHNLANFLLIITRSGRLDEISWSVLLSLLLLRN